MGDLIHAAGAYHYSLIHTSITVYNALCDERRFMPVICPALPNGTTADISQSMIEKCNG
jgi:hypothetical protein